MSMPTSVPLKDRGLTLLKVIISLGLILYLLLVKVDLPTIGRAMVHAKAVYVFAGLLLYFGAIAASCLKWQILLGAQGFSVPYLKLLSFNLEGLFFGNFLLPLIAGDVIRGYDLARDTDRAAEAAVSVLVDKLVGLLAFVVVAAIMSAYAVWGMGRTDLRAVALATFLALLGFGMAFTSMFSRRLRRLLEGLFRIRFFAPLAPIFRRLSDAIQMYRDRPRALALAFIVALGVLLLTNIVNWLVSYAVGAGVPMFYIFLFNPMIAIAPIIIPSVGGLGVNQGAFDLFYATLGGTTTSELAITFSLMMQLIIYASSLPGGVLWLRKRNPARVRSPGPTGLRER